MNNYNVLEKKFERIAKLGQAESILSWDEQVNMPSGSSSSRAHVMAEVQSIAQETLLAPEIPELLELAKSENLDEWQKANLKAMQKRYIDATAIPTELNSAWIMATLESVKAWRELRSKNDWQSYLPTFKKVVTLSKERGEALAAKYGTSTYDALLQSFQEGIDEKLITGIFSDIKSWLPEFIQAAIANQLPIKQIQAIYPIANQKSLCQAVMQEIGFDFNRGRLDVSHHPFCGGVPSDVRITTRYAENDFTKSLMATIHETGHALYEQNLPPKWEFQPVGTNLGMSIHESQSLLLEMQVGRSPSFINYLIPKIQKYFPYAKEFTSDYLTKLYHRVSPGLIRVDADEITYPAHVILRYEIEKELMQGCLDIKDIPEVWNIKMKNYLGLDTHNNYKDGCMQDVHWPSGAFGYFPSYTLGAIIAAQLFATIKGLYPHIDEELTKGNLTKVKEWLKDNIWSKGSLNSPSNLLTQATGEALTARYYKQHLINRYNIKI